MELKGQINNIIYKNELNGYCVAEFQISVEEIIIIVGNLPFINIGDTLKISGGFITHSDYGEQFKIEMFEKILPETLESLEKYLINTDIKGIGPVTAKKIIKKFGKETIHVLKYEPEKLSSIKGINEKRAIEIVKEFNEQWELWRIVSYLDKFGIGVSNSSNVYKTLGNDAINKIEKNPYILVDIVKGIEFKKIDKIALQLGAEYNNELRIQSGIKYTLILYSYNGNCCVIKEELIDFVKKLLNVETSEIENQIINLKVDKKIVLEVQEENEWIYLNYFYNAEKVVAEKLIELNEINNIKKIKNFESKLSKIEKDSEIQLSEKQREAIKAINNNAICIITGGPGTGKTTIISTIIKICKLSGLKTVLAAPTGRAAKRMSEATMQKAQTLHKLLEIGKIEDEIGFEPSDYSGKPIEADVIIIDEVSMVDIILMECLIKAIPKGSKLILVGDVNQLPSVRPGNVLKDLMSSNEITTIELNKIFRQAAKSKIIINAHNVNKGEWFIDKSTAEKEQMIEDFFYINEINQIEVLNNILSLSKERLKNYANYNFFDNIQILTPTKKGVLGTKELNKSLQKVLNPNSITKSEKKIGEDGVIFREGDKIMQIKNNYDITWINKYHSEKTGQGIFNGELGKVLKVNEKEKQIQIEFDEDRIVNLPYEDIDQIEHAYAITIHKSQGSEFDVVIIPICNLPHILLTRNLLYTALTRAKKMLIIIGDSKMIKFMINNTDSKKRFTGLNYKIIKIKQILQNY